MVLDQRARILQNRRTPHGRLIGLVLTDWQSGQAWTRLPYHPVFVGDTDSGVIHGGLVTTMVDETCGIAVQLALDQFTAIATLDLRIDYLRPATPGHALFAHAHCHHVTRSVAFVRAVAYQDDEKSPVASVVATFMLGANHSAMYEYDPPDGLQLQGTLTMPPEGEGVFGTSPYSRFLGIHMDGNGNATMPFSPRLIGNPQLPALHGGIIGAFLETTAIIGAGRETGISATPKPIGVTVSYLRSGLPEDVHARVDIVKQGRRVVAFEAQAWQSCPAKPIASAFGHFKLRQELAGENK